MNDVELIEITVRKLMVSARRKGEKVKDIARMFGRCRKTVWKWWKRTRKRGGISYRSLSTLPKTIYRKVDRKLEEQIVAIRKLTNWGTERIRKVLISAPKYLRKIVRSVTSRRFINMRISRQTINEVLKKYKMNGSPYRVKREVVLHRADAPNDIWQIDFKGPCLFGNKRTNLLVVVDDKSSSFITVSPMSKPTVENMTSDLDSVMSHKKTKPKMFLADNGPQFKEQFKEWCGGRGIELDNAPPHCPEVKGKVERGIRNLKEEFLRLNRYLENPIEDLKEYIRWYNNERYHMGIGTVPAAVYNPENVTDLG